LKWDAHTTLLLDALSFGEVVVLLVLSGRENADNNLGISGILVRSKIFDLLWISSFEPIRLLYSD